jgi:hypothetical protein
MKAWLDEYFQMPDKLVALLIRFLEQNNGVLSKKARENEFTSLSEAEIIEIEKQFQFFFK